jgi:hypothetical protein
MDMTVQGVRRGLQACPPIIESYSPSPNRTHLVWDVAFARRIRRSIPAEHSILFIGDNW